MSNETYLDVSYVAIGLISLGMGGLTYAILRVPFGALAESGMRRTSAEFLKRVQPTFLVLVASAGFFGVSYNYTGCGVLTYEQVVKDRAYLVKTNRRQVGSTADWLAAGVLVWSSVATVCVVTARRTRPEQT